MRTGSKTIISDVFGTLGTLVLNPYVKNISTPSRTIERGVEIYNKGPGRSVPDVPCGPDDRLSRAAKADQYRQMVASRDQATRKAVDNVVRHFVTLEADRLDTG